MSSDFDVGPLTWVKGEIDLALQRAGEALTAFAENPADDTRLKFAQTHLHQAHGALSVVGLDGITQFTESIEQLIGVIERDHPPHATSAAAAAEEAITAVRHYLDDIVAGMPNQPLRLYPQYHALAVARRSPDTSPAELFYPDLNQRPPRRERQPAPLPAAQLELEIRRARFAYQRGLLKWLKHDDRGLGEMRTALDSIEKLQTQPAARSFWWAALALMDVLSGGGVSIDLGSRRLCARIDSQIRKLLGGSRTVAERLMRDVLYNVAVSTSVSKQVELVRSAYRLADLVPTVEAHPAIVPMAGALRAVRELLATAKDDWNRFAAGTASALPQFHECATQLAAQAQELGQVDFSRLMASIAAVAAMLRKEPLQGNEANALEVATALLLAENALDGFANLGVEFAHQVDVMAGRLNALLRGEPLQAMQAPQLDEMSRRAQERLLMSHVAREVQTNLAQIEQTLDAFFRDPSRNAELAALGKPMKQVEGALSVLGEMRAVDVLRECEAELVRFAGDDYKPAPEDFEAVANKLSAIGFFVERLQHGKADIDAIMTPGAKPEIDEAGAGEAAASVEAELAQATRDARTLMDALKEKPGDEALRGEIKQNLEAIRDDAGLVADSRLEQGAVAAIAALESAAPESAAAHLEKALADIATAPVAAAPSKEAVRLAGSSAAEIDAELLEIFIEEAHDVLAAVNENYQRVLAQAHDREALTTVRRSFHTLKGSGRMVGLSELGETAWAVEQVLNRWLQGEMELTPALLAMIRDAQKVFEGWVNQLESGGGRYYDSAALVAACERLKLEGGEPPETPPPGAAIPPSHPAAEVPQPVAPATPPPAAVAEAMFASEEVQQIELPELEPIDFEMPEEAPGSAIEDIALGDTSLSPTLYEMYLEEARTHLATLDAELGSPGSQPSPEMIRAAHTLAGISATVGIAPVNKLAHALEGALVRFAAAPAAMEAEEHQRVSATVVHLRHMVDRVSTRQMPDEESVLSQRLNELNPPEHLPEALAIANESGREVEAVVAESLPVPTPPEQPSSQPAVMLPAAAEHPAAESHGEGAHEGDRRKLRLTDDLDPQLLPVFLEEAQDLLSEVGADLRHWRANPEDQEAALRLKRLLHTLKGSARMAGAMTIGEIVHGIESHVDQLHGAPALAFLDEFDAAFDRVHGMVEDLAHPELRAAAVETEAAAPGAGKAAETETAESEVELAAARAMLRVRADMVDKLANEAGEMAIARSRIEGEMRTLKISLLDLTENVIRLRGQLREIEIQAESQMQSRQAMSSEKHMEFDPLEFDRFTRFQELTRMMAESVNDVTTVQHTLLRNLENADAAVNAQARLNRELSQALMSVRMVPFNSIADRLYRIVRQSGKEAEKRANLDIRGGQTELDRSVLEKMTGPLEHLLRNAIGHGLEPAEWRRSAGKAEIGQITLNVTQAGNEISIELSDDGRGLDFGRIRAKAVERGLIAADQPASDAQLTQMIFMSGFSTAEELTEMAGRGVGMDVVKNETAALGGRIEVHTQSGRGTTFRILLPLTLAVTQAVLARAGGRTYVIPSAMVAQVLELRADMTERVRNEGLAEWLGQSYAYRYLPRLLGDTTALPQTARRHWVLLLRAGTQRLAVEVDDMLGNQEIVVKNIGEQISRVVGISGATVLGDGEIALIINPIALASREATLATLATPATPAPAPEPVASAPIVMVVDDSLTVRKITGRLLAREGYQVITAKDGVDALEQTLEVVPDVMLVDIEMPRMDGFDLTRNVRADARLKNVPIIMITSRIADKHRNYAKDIGVNNYLGKPYDEDELLRLIAGYVNAVEE
jgi:chemosensory pili system protein ChpA (sensor histidine kinase/response regulator)